MSNMVSSQVGIYNIFLQCWRYALVAVLFCSCAAFGLGLSFPKYYTSVAFLAIGEVGVGQMEARIKTSDILGPIVLKHGDPAMIHRSLVAQERHQAERIHFGTQPGENRKSATIFRLEVDHRDPREAQAIGNALIEAWLESTKPLPFARAQIMGRIARTEEQLKLTNALIERIESEAPKLVLPSSLQGELATPLIAMIKQRDTYAESLVSMRLSLLGASRDVILAPASLPVEPKSRHLGVFAAIGAIAGLMLAMAYRVAMVRFRSAKNVATPV